MPNTNSSFSPVTRATQFHALLEKLEALGHRQATDEELDQFDNETEELLGLSFGPTDARLEAYKYATDGEMDCPAGTFCSDVMAPRVIGHQQRP